MTVLITSRASSVFERNVVSYRREWIALVTGFFEPVFYLFSLGVGIGALVGDVLTPVGRVPYAQFVAPALLAAAAMNGAVFDATFNLFFKLRYARTYEAILATPVGPRDVAAGETLWSLARGGLYVVGFFLVAAAMGLVASPWGLLAVPAALLVSFAFCTVGMAATSFMRDFRDFDYVELAILPLFLLSATFYPLATYPEQLQLLVRLSPLYQGVALERGLMLGDLSWALLGHAAVLVALGMVGLAVVGRRIEALLLR